MNHAQSPSSREQTLESLGNLLPNYARLQSEYNSKIHVPDSCSFSKHWEDSLFRPVRDDVRIALDGLSRCNDLNLLYCAPGQHAPLLRRDDELDLMSRLGAVTLLDIDASALAFAKNSLQSSNADILIETVAVDFSGPFGQRLCNLYVDTLRDTSSLAHVAQRLGEASFSIASIFFDADQVLVQLNSHLSHSAGERENTISVSEMAASFTGTAVWLAFRSVLFQKFARIDSRAEMEECLKLATELWQKYNELFLGVHLDFLQARTAKGGIVVVVFDTRKVYDDCELGTLAAFKEGTSITEICVSRRLQILRHSVLHWRDLPLGFDVKLCGLPVSDFQAHTHDVDLYVLQSGH